MNKIILIYLLSLSIGTLLVYGMGEKTSPTEKTQPQEQTQSQTPASIKTVSIPVQGMTCNGCAIKIKTQLNQTEGILSCTVAHKEGTVECQYDTSKLTVSDIKNASNETGFIASDIPDKP